MAILKLESPTFQKFHFPTSSNFSSPKWRWLTPSIDIIFHHFIINPIAKKTYFFIPSTVSLLFLLLSAEKWNFVPFIDELPHEEHEVIVHITHNTPFFNGGWLRLSREFLAEKRSFSVSFVFDLSPNRNWSGVSVIRSPFGIG